MTLPTRGPRFKASRHFVVASAMLLSASAACIAAEPSLCEPGEKVWLNATVAASDRMVSLCGRSWAGTASNGAAGWLQFRMGRPGQIDIAYPDRRTRSRDAFVFRRYTRPRTTYLKLEFAVAGRHYAILENFEADFDPRSSARLRVSRLGDKSEISSETLRLRTEPLSILGLESHLPTKPFDE